MIDGIGVTFYTEKNGDTIMMANFSKELIQYEQLYGYHPKEASDISKFCQHSVLTWLDEQDIKYKEYIMNNRQLRIRIYDEEEWLFAKTMLAGIRT